MELGVNVAEMERADRIIMEGEVLQPTNMEIVDIYDVLEAILLHCPRRVWLIFNDNRK
jgi:hypothetical protein